jgi:sulfite exporter TauE/SafE
VPTLYGRRGSGIHEAGGRSIKRDGRPKEVRDLRARPHMKSILLLGLLMGMRHALEADHLAAVASLSTQGGGLRAGIIRGSAWGLGHTFTLLVLGGICLALGAAIPARLANVLEAAVGVMLIALGLDVFRRMRRGKIHIHVHRHGDEIVHVHAHRHADHEPHPPVHHHSHPTWLPMRPFLVGTVHGMAGSAALLLLTVQTVASPWIGIGYIGLFGLGSVVGMAALSAVITWPMQTSARVFDRTAASLDVVVGVVTLAVGMWVLWGSGALGCLGCSGS